MSGSTCTQAAGTSDLTASPSVAISPCTASAYESSPSNSRINTVALGLSTVAVLLVSLSAVCIACLRFRSRREMRRGLMSRSESTASELNLPQKPAMHEIVFAEESILYETSWTQFKPLSVQLQAQLNSPPAQNINQGLRGEVPLSRWLRHKKRANAKATEEAEMDAAAAQRIETAVLIQMPEPASNKEANQEYRGVPSMSIGQSVMIVHGTRVG